MLWELSYSFSHMLFCTQTNLPVLVFISACPDRGFWVESGQDCGVRTIHWGVWVGWNVSIFKRVSPTETHCKTSNMLPRSCIKFGVGYRLMVIGYWGRGRIGRHSCHFSIQSFLSTSRTTSSKFERRIHSAHYRLHPLRTPTPPTNGVCQAQQYKHWMWWMRHNFANEGGEVVGWISYWAMHTFI